MHAETRVRLQGQWPFR